MCNILETTEKPKKCKRELRMNEAVEEDSQDQVWHDNEAIIRR